MWVEILNKSFKEPVKIKKNQPLGFAVIKLEHLKFKYETSDSKRKKVTHTEKRERRSSKSRERYRQLGSFLNCYEFAYAVREVVNQAAKVAPGVVEAATNDINAIATDRISKVISQGGKEMERVLPKILRGAIEDVYQTPFRLLGNFGKQQFNKIKRKISN